MVCATPARLAGTRRRFNILLNVVFLLTLTEIFSPQNEAFLPRNWKSSPTPSTERRASALKWTLAAGLGGRAPYTGLNVHNGTHE